MENRIILTGGEGEIVEKKSRFIATIRPVKSEEEAASFIKEMKKKYYDARHNCSAYILGGEKRIERSSDDGEPGGTAGRPMLEVLQGEGLSDVCVVVTRYFGGVLLGTGGLVRAYQGAVKEGLKSCTFAVSRRGFLLTMSVSYGELGKAEHYLREHPDLVLNAQDYLEKVVFRIFVPTEHREATEADFTEMTQGKAVMHWSEEQEQEIR